MCRFVLDARWNAGQFEIKRHKVGLGYVDEDGQQVVREGSCVDVHDGETRRDGRGG